MSRYVCTRCEVALKPVKVGATVAQMFGEPPEPYKLWAADVWGCPECDLQICVRSHQPFAEHYQANFSEALEKVKAEADQLLVYEFER